MKGWDIVIELADGQKLTLFVPSDFIYDQRLCRVKIYSMQSDSALVEVPLPIPHKSRLVKVSQQLLEWHR